MKQLSPEQRELVSALAMRLGAVRGIRAVVLGGSHARGRAQPGSDIDLGILYSEVAPFSIQSVRELAQDVNDTAGPMVTDFYEWGPWVNGGAWLTLGGQRVDFVYRNLDQVERVIVEAEAGGYERAPREFGPRVQKTLANLGGSPAELVAAVPSIAQMLRETVALAEGLYRPCYTLPT